MSTIIALRILFILGLVNVFSGLLLLFTCRCLPMSRFGKGLMARRWFVKVYKYHCYIWWVFWASVVVHAVLAFRYMGWPF